MKKGYFGLVFVLFLALAFLLDVPAQAGAPKTKAGKAKQTNRAVMRDGSRKLRGVVVTATKRALSAQDVPFSLNVKSEEDLRRMNTSNLEDLSRNVAGLSIQNLGPGQSVVNIRGISSGQIVRDQPGVKEQVSVYLDETPVSLSLFTPDLDLFDVQRVETLRGPQGTLFGAGSIGGTVRYITNQPLLSVNEMKAEVGFNTVDGGSSGGDFKFAVNIPVGDSIALRGVAYGTQYPGFIDALRDGGGKDEDVNDGTRYGGRLAVLLKPSENISITPRVVYQKVELDGFNRDEIFNIFANPYSTTRPQVKLGEREQFLLRDEEFEDEVLLLDTAFKWELENLFDLNYTVSYTNRDILVSRDASALTGSVGVTFCGLARAGMLGEGALCMPVEAILTPANLRDNTDMQQFTQEVHLSSNYSSALQWLVGFFYADMERDYAQRVPTPGYDQFLTDANIGTGSLNGFTDMDSPYMSELTYDLRQYAVFGEATYTLLERLGLTAGLRYYNWEEDKTFRSGGIFSNSDAQNQDVTVDSDGVAPRFIVSYDATDQITVNAQASRGFRLGGINDPLNQPLCGGDAYETYREYQEFKDETLWNYEVGLKSAFNMFSLNGSVFYADIENLGVNIDVSECSSRITLSVPEAHTMGAELELSVQPFDPFLVTFAGSYVEAEFDSTVRDVNNNVIEGMKKGNRIPSVPDWQFSAAATYTLPGLLSASGSYLSASWEFVGDQITQPGDQESGQFPSSPSFTGPTLAEQVDLNFRDSLKLDSYHLINLKAGLDYDNMELMFYVDNVTDKNTRLSFDRERGGRARLAYRVGQPRTFGMVARVAF